MFLINDLLCNKLIYSMYNDITWNNEYQECASTLSYPLSVIDSLMNLKLTFS